VTDHRFEGALFVVTLVLLVAAPVVAIGGRRRATVVAGCLLSVICLVAWAALVGLDLSTGPDDCAVSLPNKERETVAIALVCGVVPAAVAIGAARIRRLALASAGATVFASVVVVACFAYLVTGNPVC
jgi:hypothetical protein